MPGLHFSSYGHVKPPLLHALSLKRKKTNVAAAAAAAVLKAFTNPRGKHVLVRQGVKYRNMFHAGGGLVRERRPGEEVTPEKAGWVTDEESEQSETESSDEAAPVTEEASILEEATEAAEEMMDDDTESMLSEVEDEKESTLDLIPEDEVTKNDLLKLELSLVEKELPKLAPISPTSMAKMEEKIVEVPVIPVEEPALEALPTQEETLPVETDKLAPEIIAEVAMPTPTQEEPVEVITCIEQKVSDAVALVPERQPEQLLEPPGPESLSLSAVMSILQPRSQTKPMSLSEMILEPPSQSAPVALSAVMNVLERPSESEPVTSPTMFVLESPEPVSTAIPITIEVAEPLESDLAPATVSDTPAVIQLDTPVEVEEMQEEVVGDIQETQVAHADIEEIAVIPSLETLEPTPEANVVDIPSDEVVEMELTPTATELPVVAMSEPTIATPDPTTESVVTIPAAIPELTLEPVVTIPVAPEPSVALEPTVGPEPLDPPVVEPIVTTPEQTDTSPMLQPILPQSIPEPTIEVEVQREELDVVVEDVGVDKVLPISLQVVSPPQKAPVLAISEKHSEQLLDDEVCDYTETELNEDEESEVEVNEQEELEGRLECTPSHMFKLTLSLPISTKTSTSSTVALCVKPEQTLSDLQKLIQHELSHSSSVSHISFTTIATDPPPDYNGNTAPTNTSTGFAIKDSEHSVLRKSPCLDQSKYHNPTIIPTRWSLSTEIGAFIGDASKAQSFAIEISPAPDKPPSTIIRVSLPTFDNRVSHMRSQLRLLGPNLSSLSALKSECDLLAHRSAQKHSILKLSISGLACLFLPLILIAFTYLSQPGLLPSFRNPPPWDWDTNLSHPVTTYLAAGFIDILLLAGFAYLWSAYRSNGNQSLPDHATIKRVYSERGFDIKIWEELQAENKRLRDEIRRVAAEYDVTWDDEIGETKEAGTAATAA